MSKFIAVVSYKINDDIINKYCETEEQLVEIKKRLNEFDLSFMVKRFNK